MVKKVCFLLMALMLAISGFSQTNLNEGFEGTTFPPGDWTQSNVSGSPWAYNTEESNGGSHSVYFPYQNGESWLITPKLSITASNHTLTFYAKGDFDDAGATLSVQVSTTNNSVSSFLATALNTLSSGSSLTTSWTQITVDLSSYIGQTIYVGFHATCINYASSIYIDDVAGPELYLPSCLKPTNLVASNVVQTSATLNWTKGSATDAAWYVYYKEATATDYTAVNVTTVPFTITGLSANTQYSAYVRTNCGADTSNASTIITFKTPCEAITVFPWTEGFETENSCLNIASSGTYKWTTTASGSHPTCSPYNSSSKMLYFNCWNASTGSWTTLATPPLTFTEQMQVTYWLYKNTTGTSSVSLYVNSNPDTVGATLLGTESVKGTTVGWTKINYVLPVTAIGTQYIIIKGISDYTNNLHIDSLTVAAAPSCLKPTNLVASNVVQTSATLNWTKGKETDAAWYVYYKEATATDYTAVNVTTVPFTITGLNANTQYSAYVRTNCGTDTSDASSTIITFKTPCEAITVFPWTEGFETENSCLNIASSETYKWTTTASGSHPTCSPYNSSSKMLYFNCWNASTGAWTTLATPPLTFTEQMQVTYWLYKNTTGTSSVSLYVNSNPDTVGATLLGTESVAGTTVGWTKINYVLPVTAIGTQYIIIKGISDYTNNLHIDSLTVAAAPSCLKPTNLVASNATISTIDLSWTKGSISDAAWRIYYKKIGATTWDSVDVTNNTYTLTNLQPSAIYNVTIATKCSSSELSEQSVVINAATSCDQISSLPWTENFDGYGSATYPNCWSKIEYIYYGSTYPYLYTFDKHSGTKSLYLYNTAIAITPQINTTTNPINTLRVKFYAKLSYSPYKIGVGIMTDPTDLSTLTLIDSVTLSSTWQQFEISLEPYIGTGSYIAFNVLGTSSYKSAYLDDVDVLLLPACKKPTNLVASNVVQTSATLNWTKGSATDAAWYVYYKEATATDYTAVNVTTVPFTITGLSANTQYSAYVRTNCGADTSNASTIITFKTPCEAITVFPWTEGFETENSCLNIASSGTYKWTTTASGSHPTCSPYNSSSKMLYFNCWNASTGSWTTLATPPLTFTEQMQVTYWLYKNTIGTSSVSLYVNSNPDTVGATLLGTESVKGTTVGWTKINYVLPVTAIGTQYIIIKGISDYTNNLHIDSLTVAAAPSCLKPTNLVVSNVVQTSATLNWTNGSATDAAWYVYYKEATATDYTAVNVTTVPFTITGLSANTQYSAYVRTNCGTDTSDASTIITFKTPCEAITVFPWTEGFETENSCLNIASSGTYKWTTTASGSNPTCSPYNSSSKMLYFNCWNALTGAWTTLATPPLTFTEQMQVTYWLYKNTIGTSSVSLYVNSTPDTVGATLLGTESVTGTTVGWTKINYVLPVTAIGTQYIIIKGISDFNNNLHIDSLTVAVAPSCLKPTNLVASSVVQTSATLNWTNGSATDAAWYVYYKEATATDYTAVNVTTVPFTITGLNANTQYSAYVRTNCGTDTSDASTIITFKTPCEAITVFPWTEGFETENSCLNIASSGTYKWTTTASGSNPTCSPYNSSSKMLYFNCWNASIGAWTTLTTPPLTFTEQMQVTYWMYKYNPSYGNYTDSIFTYINSTPDIVGATLLGGEVLEGTQSGWTKCAYTVPSTLTGTQYIILKALSNNGYNIYIDSLTVLPYCMVHSYDTLITSTICQGESYMFGGVARTTAGTYVDSLQTINGCDSVITLTLNVNPTYNTPLTQTICQGESYMFGGVARTTAGTYVDSLQTINGCDSVITLTLTVNPTYNTPLTQTICQGESYMFGGVARTTAGTYVDSLQTINGCDSVITLTLNVNPTYNTPLTQTICQGESYLFGGVARTTAGTYTDTLQTINGCDSVITLTLNVNPTYHNVINATINEGETYNLYGFTETTSGTYIDTLQTIKGCDSIITLNLIVYDTASTNIVASICQGETYSLNGFSETITGIYKHVLQTINGADSTVNLYLTVNPTYNTPLTQTICQGESYMFGGLARTTAGTYTDTLQTINGCDSVITLTLNVNPTYNTPLTQTICQGESYLFGGVARTTAGTYTDTLQTIKGCDSVITLTLNVNPTYNTPLTQTICQGESYMFGGTVRTTAGTYTDTLQTIKGCDSVITLTLNVNPIYNTPLTQTICQGESYMFDGVARTTAGTYTDTLQTINGCDSVITLTLNVNPTYNTPLTQTICQGESYMFGGTARTSAGTYTDTLQTINGCDSVITLTLNVNPTYNTPLTQTICQGESYMFGGVARTTAGTYTDTLQTIKGCDSVITLTLNVNPTYNTPLTQTICQGESYMFGGLARTSAGTYTDTLQTIKGCDSVITLTLNVNPTYNTPLTQTICQGESYTFGGQTLTSAGTYTDTLQTVNGCDSVVTLTLNVNPTYNTPLTQTICQGESYMFGGTVRTTAGTYTDTLQTINGCDSVITLTLNVNPIYNIPLTQTICQGESYTFGGQTLTSAGTYTDTLQTSNGCDSVVTLTLAVNPTYNDTILATINQGETYNLNGFNADSTGIYVQTLQSINGCDSTVVLNLTVQSSLNSIDNENLTVTLYPNPTRERATLSIEGLKEKADVRVYDLQGREVQSQSMNAGQKTITLDVSTLAKGAYSIRITTSNGKNITRKLIVQ